MTLKQAIMSLKAKLERAQKRHEQAEKIRLYLALIILAILAWTIPVLFVNDLLNSKRTISFSNPSPTVVPTALAASAPAGTLSDQEAPKSPVSKELNNPTEGSKNPSTDIEGKVCKKWGTECKVAIAVMKAESQGDPRRIGDKHLTFWKEGREYGASYGLFQLRDLPGRFNNPQDMLDEDKNIDYAYAMYQKSGWRPWSAYTNKTYLRYL